MKWFLQEEDWGIGDFVILTPALVSLRRITGEKVKVFFTNSQLADVYRDSDVIEVLGKRPDCEPSGDNKYQRTLLRDPEESEYEVHHKVIIGPQFPMPAPHVPSCRGAYTSLFTKRKVAIFFGCSHKRFIEAKRVSPELILRSLQCVLELGAVPVLLGNYSDYVNYWEPALTKWVQSPHTLNLINKLTLREAVNVISQCDAFISNDTGLMHVANALEKPGVAFWGETPLRKLPYAQGVKHYQLSRQAAFESFEYLFKDIFE